MLAESPQGKYANYFEIGCNKEELIIVFGQRYVGELDPPCMHTRITMSPAYGRELLETLSKALDADDTNYLFDGE